MKKFAIRSVRPAVKAAVASLAVLGTSAFAQAVDPKTTILAKVNSGMEGGLEIAVGVVIGMFAIWGVKVLWKGK